LRQSMTDIFSSTISRTSVFVAVCLLIFDQSLGNAKPSHPLVFDQQSAQIGKYCFEFGGNLNTEDAFFQDLKRTETNSRVRFHKGDKDFVYFPESLKIQIYAAGKKCKPSTDSQDDEYPRIDLMRTFHFDVYWKEGVTLRRAREVTPTFLSSLQDGQNSAIASGIWNFTFEVKDSNIPLTNHLVVVISSTGDKDVARMSAKLY